LIAHVPIPAAQVHAWDTSGNPEQSARHYADTLKRFYGSDTLDPSRALFDVMFLGLGEDGHTASLFPGVAALQERTAWTAAVVGAKPEPRLTMTYPVLGSSNVVAFIASGKAKKAILARAYAGDAALPAAGVRPLADLIWFIDEAAEP
jgi:6-phosphogluconolactonase